MIMRDQAASGAPLVEFKGTTLSVMSVLLHGADLPALSSELDARLGPTPDFFSGEAAVLEFALGVEPAPGFDWAGLMTLLRRHNLVPVAVRGLAGPVAEAAAAAGLALVGPEERGSRRRQDPPAPTPAESAPAAPAPSATTTPPSPGATALATGEDIPCLVVDKPLRSGQQVYARGGDLVVLAMVSAGAEVIADGNVHVYAPLRGRALAGARGNTRARIFTTCFEAELVSIAGVYRTFETAAANPVAKRPAQVCLADGDNGPATVLAIEPLSIG